MTFKLLELPDEPAARIAALEGHLLAPDFPEAVGSLLAVQGFADPAPEALAALSEAEIEDLLRDGLAALPRERLDQVLLRPLELLRLRERILSRDAGYWSPRLEALSQAVTGASASRRPRRGAVPLRRSLVLVAAGLVVGFGLAWFLPRDEPVWGWLAPDALPDGATAREYLLRLAARGEQWFAERPDTSDALARRVHELRRGCTRLIFAAHAPLAPGDRAWLVERCRVWARALDEQLARLEGGDPPLERRAALDEVVTKLVNALRIRAETL